MEMSVSPVKDAAIRLGIAVVQPATIKNNAEFRDQLAAPGVVDRPAIDDLLPALAGLRLAMHAEQISQVGRASCRERVSDTV